MLGRQAEWVSGIGSTRTMRSTRYRTALPSAVKNLRMGDGHALVPNDISQREHLHALAGLSSSWLPLSPHMRRPRLKVQATQKNSIVMPSEGRDSSSLLFRPPPCLLQGTHTTRGLGIATRRQMTRSDGSRTTERSENTCVLSFSTNPATHSQILQRGQILEATGFDRLERRPL